MTDNKSRNPSIENQSVHLPRLPARWSSAIALSVIAAVAPLHVAQATTTLQFSTQYENHNVVEHYVNDLDTVFESFNQARYSNSENTSRHPVHYHEIQIVDVGASVYSDTDRDGYFTRFSISFDVDTDYRERWQETWVYAKLYLRKDGSDYELFHTSEQFEIYDSLGTDSYQLDNHLIANYEAAYYDIRIEIFDASNHTFQDSVDSSTHRTLSALPLESDFLDDGPPDSISHEHVGSMAWAGLLVLVMFLRRRHWCAG